MGESVRNTCDCRRLTHGVRPLISFTLKGHDGSAISWHDAVQVHLVFGLSEANVIGLFADCRTVLLDPPVASLAKTDFHQGLAPPADSERKIHRALEDVENVVES